MWKPPAVSAAVIAAATLLLAGCGSGGSGQNTASGASPARTAAASSSAPATPTATPTPTKTAKPKPRKFTAKIIKITKKSQVKHSWHEGCPVSLSGLRMIEMTYHGFDHKVHTGKLVVAKSATHDMVTAFRKLFKQKYPIREMKPVDAYDGSDYKSIDADNTSAFNCRIATGSSSWSEHSYGKAVDLNPCENPYVYADGHSEHKHCRKYNDRERDDRGLIHAGDSTVDAFASVGWGWGGAWSGDRDYQHFSASGR